MNENNKEYDFIYECLSEEWIYKCAVITQHYLKENYLTEDAVSYCIECLFGFLLETGLFKQPELIGQPKNKRDYAHNQEVHRIQQKRMDLSNASLKRRKERNKLIASKRRATMLHNKNNPPQRLF